MVTITLMTKATIMTMIMTMMVTMTLMLLFQHCIAPQSCPTIPVACRHTYFTNQHCHFLILQGDTLPRLARTGYRVHGWKVRNSTSQRIRNFCLGGKVQPQRLSLPGNVTDTNQQQNKMIAGLTTHRDTASRR